MKKRLDWSTRAVADLNEVWEFTETNWDWAQADDYTGFLEAQARAVAGGQGRAREVVVNGISYLRVRGGSHAIFLLDGHDRLLVVRILHLKQDVSSGLGHSTQSSPMSR